MCPLGIWSHVCSFEDSIRSSIPSFWSFFSPASQNPREHACLLIAGLATHCWQFVSVLHFFSSEPTMAGIHSVHSHMVAHCVAEKQTPSLSKVFDGYFHFFPPLYPASPLFLQLHGANGDCAVSRLPRGLREQPQLRLADHLRAWHQDSFGIQRLWPGASLWFPHC